MKRSRSEAGTDPQARIAALERELEVNRAALARSREAGLAFVSVLAHDLKTPLAGIRLFADLLRDGAVDDAQTHQLAVISAETDRLTHTIAIAQDYQRLCLGRFEWREAPTDMVDLIERVARPFALACHSKGLAFSCDTASAPASILLDGGRVASLLYALLANALSLTHQGVIAVVAGAGGSVTRPGLHLSVSNSGAAMNRQRSQLLLKGMSPTADVTDTVAMGLSLVRHVVDHYQGRIDVDGTAQGGCVVHIDLPSASISD